MYNQKQMRPNGLINIKERVKLNNLKHLRLSRETTQQNVAEQCGIALRTYQRIERGERNGDISIWQRLAKYFNTTIDHLLEQEADNNLSPK